MVMRVKLVIATKAPTPNESAVINKNNFTADEPPPTEICMGAVSTASASKLTAPLPACPLRVSRAALGLQSIR